MSKLRVLLVCILFSNITFSQTILAPGDIAIVQMNNFPGTNTEIMKFVALTSMDAGTEIHFTDNGWSGTALNIDEGTTTWTAGGIISCGDIITLTLTGGVDIENNEAGESLLAYQGTVGSPVTFIFGIHTSVAEAWDANAGSVNDSALPTDISASNLNLVLRLRSSGNPGQRENNYKYTGSLSGTKTTILSNIATKANWTGIYDTLQDFTDTFTSDTTFLLAGVWSPGSSDYFNATIMSNYSTTSDGDFDACLCTVNAAATVTVNSGGTVLVEEAFTNNGAIIVEDGGSVIQTVSGVNTGTAYTVIRDTQSLASAYQYTMWSSPLASSTLTEVVSDADRYLSFNANTQAYNFLSSANSMTAGLGYFAQGSNGGTYPGTNTATFTGSAFNNGDKVITLGFVGTAGAGDDDWNMVGNPYPSAIFADDFLTENSATIGGTIYLWNHSTDHGSEINHTQDDYASYNLSGGVGTASINGGTAPTGYIASGQGFWVEAIAAGTVTFTNAVRSGGVNNTDFFKSQKKSLVERNRIWLNLTSDQDFSQILVGFFENATDGVDRTYDGKYLNGGGNISFYSVLEDTPYVIQGLSALKGEQVIPLGFSNTKVGSFKIAIGKKEGKLTGAKIVLEDKLLNIEHRLDISDYEFNTEEIGNFKERFVLTINAEKDSNDSSVLELNTYVRDNNLHIDYLNDTNKIKRVSIYSMTGSVFYDSKIKTYEGVIPVNNLKSKGIYILRIQLNSGAIITKKIII